MMHRTTFPALLALAVFGVAEIGSAQRGRRRSEEVLNRLGAYFVTTTLPSAEDGQKAIDRLAANRVVTKAVAVKELSLLYLYDATESLKKHKKFEETLFSSDPVCIALRCFRTGMINLAEDASAKALFGKKAPLFVAFDAKGKRVGELSLKGYKPRASQLNKTLERAARGYAKLALGDFVKKYRSFLNDLEVHEGRKRALNSKRAKEEEKSGRGVDAKLAKIDKEIAALTTHGEKMLAGEEKLLDDASVPERDPKAERVGERQWRR